MVCSPLKLARSSFYADKKAKINYDSLDNEIWGKIVKLWVDLPGIGYRKLSKYLNIGGKRILRILKKYRGRKTDKPKHKSLCLSPNIIKLITKDLVNYPQKLKRGN